MLETWLAIALAFTGFIRSLSGTVVTIDTGAPTMLMVRAESQFQSFPVAQQAVVERESRFVGSAAAATTRIDRSDLTPGEYVRLEIDAGVVTHVRAVVSIERAKVRSASGRNVVLEDGTTLTISSVLRFLTAEGKPSTTATVRPGDGVLLFRHPETRNIYQFSAEAPR